MIKKYYPQILIFACVCILAIVNFRTGTILSGWDNLHPELNFGLNIYRSFFGVWQEYQGLGLIGGLAYSADLPRQILLWISSFVLPQNVLRYLYTSSMLLIGPLGMFYLLDHILDGKDQRIHKMVSFVGSIYYLLNIATVQIFFTPFDAFVTHYGFLPWLVYVFILNLQKLNRKNILLFIFLNILAIPQGFVTTIFVVYLLAFLLIIALLFWETKDKKVLVTGAKLGTLLIVINSYWFLPFVYYTVSHAMITVNSHMSYMSTEDIFERNKQFGDFVSVMALKGFSYNFVDINANRGYSYLLGAWRDHIDSSLAIAGFGFSFAIIILGFINALRKKYAFGLAFCGLFLFTFTMLASDTFPFSLADSLLRQFVPFFSQIFRVTYTKFGNLALFSYTIMLSFGLLALFRWFKIIFQERHMKIFSVVSWLIPVFMLAIFLFEFSPAFKGELLYSKERLTIPSGYVQLFNFFAPKDVSERIAILPQNTFWGWRNYSWGYGGSGFEWFGIAQPTMDRAFDGYSGQNENYYWEISQAIYSKNQSMLNTLFDKYSISWVVNDRSIINPSSPNALFQQGLVELLEKNENISLTQRFGDLDVYKVKKGNSSTKFVSMSANLPRVEPEVFWLNVDLAYKEVGSYFMGSADKKPTAQKYNLYYPFRSLFTGRRQSDLEFTIEDKGQYFSFSSKIPREMAGKNLILPPIVKSEVSEIDQANLLESRQVYPTIYMDGNLLSTLNEEQMEVKIPGIKEGKLEVRVPKIWGYYSYDNYKDLFIMEKKNCDQFNTGAYDIGKVRPNGNDMLELSSLGSSNCIDFNLPELSHEYSYIISVESKNVEGKSLMFALMNSTSERADLETYLPKSTKSLLEIFGNDPVSKSYFVVPPMEPDGRGYTLHFDNVSIGRERTINDLGKITVNPIPYNFLTSLKIVDSAATWQKDQVRNFKDFEVSHPNPSYYEISTSKEFMNFCSDGSCGDRTLILSQSFDKGWKAYAVNNPMLLDSWYMKLLIPFFSPELKDHVLVNNWENGWNLSNESMKQCSNDSNNCTVALIYLPQYLEYAGFILLGGFGLYLLLTRQQKNVGYTMGPQRKTRSLQLPRWIGTVRAAAATTFSRRQATLTGPTPPGIGVYHEDTSEISASL